MNNLKFSWLKVFAFCLLPAIPCSLLAVLASAQAVPYARTFPRGKDDVEATLKEMQAYAGQKLPIVDGFVAMGEQPLDHYERAYYQFSIDVLPNGGASTIVRLSAKITAWYADRAPAKSGYQALPSNGRLELDLLDRLGEKFGSKALLLPRTGPLLPKPKIDAAGNPLPDTVAPTGRMGATGNSSDPEAGAMAALKLKREAEEKRMLELKSQLYASISIMAGSYAHNIKNLLVRPNDLLRRCLEADGLNDDQEQMLHEVRQTLGTVTERLQQATIAGSDGEGIMQRHVRGVELGILAAGQPRVRSRDERLQPIQRALGCPRQDESNCLRFESFAQLEDVGNVL